MAAERLERRLAAVLAADVAGYSRLVGSDEEGTIAALRAIRTEIIDPGISEHRGRLVKTTGDGLLVEFSSAVDALRCAVHVQRAIAARDKEASADRQIKFRIGIHQGDIVVDDGDILGDGVNIAARLEGLAEPGGICVSARIQEDASGKLDLTFEDLGEPRLKNIARPVRVYAVKPAAESPTVPVLLAKPRTSIVVLPFVNLSEDLAQEYFADGITDDLTTDLSQITGSFVIARHTAFTYKGKPADVKQIGRDLSVRYVIEGSVRRMGDYVRINVRLIETDDGATLWVGRFDTSRESVDQAQDEITSSVAHTLNREVVMAAFRQTQRQSRSDPDAKDLVMRGWAWWHQPTTATARQEAREAFTQALALEPHSADAKIGLAATITQVLVEGWSEAFADDVASAERLLREVLTDNPHQPTARAQMAVLRRVQNRLGEAQVEAEIAIASDRNNELALKQLCQILLFQGEPLAAIPHLEKAIRLNSKGPNRWSIEWPLGQCHLLLGHVDPAIDLFRRACTAKPELYFLHLNLSGALGLRGDLQGAQLALSEALRLRPQINTIAQYRAATPWITHPKHWALRDQTLNVGLRRAGFMDG